MLDPRICYLNHGSYGATPKLILAAQQKYRELMESAPTVFMRSHLPEKLAAARVSLSQFVRSNPHQIAFCTHATEGTNAILRSLKFRPDDEIVVTNHGYGAVTQALNFLHDTFGVQTVVAQIPYPLPATFDVVSGIEKVLTPKTKLVIIDAITSPTALIFPVAEVVALCRQKKIPILVDGAHVPGHLPLDLGVLKPDFYVGNFHKWMCAPKGSAFLYADEMWLNKLHPLSVSHHYKSGFTEEFDWTGTTDLTPRLCFPECVEWFNSLGGFDGLVKRNRHLVFEAATLLNKECGLQWGHAADKNFMGCMVAMIVPNFVPHPKAHIKFIDTFFKTTGIDVQASVFENRFLVRISAQAYNCLEDYERLANELLKFNFLSLA